MRRKLMPLVAAPGVLILMAGCGSSTKVTSPTTVPATTSSAPASAASSKVTVGAESSKYGSILEANGRTLYAFSIDTATTSGCPTGACTTAWPPLAPSATPTFGSGVTPSMIGSLSRPDGSHQVTYAGHPLYYFAGDTAAGDINGQGINHFGGTWHVVSASTGQPVTTAPSSSASSNGSTAGATTTTTVSSYKSY